MRLTALALALAACSDVSVIDVQAAACLRLEECAKESFDEQYADQQACVNDYDDTTSICYDLHCTYDSKAAATCRDDIGAQSCDDLNAFIEVPSCLPEAIWESCDEAALSTCLTSDS